MSTQTDYVYINYKLLSPNKNSKNRYLHILKDSIYEIYIKNILHYANISTLNIYYLKLCKFVHAFIFLWDFKMSLI
jgi:hypothetical protein